VALGIRKKIYYKTFSGTRSTPLHTTPDGIDIPGLDTTSLESGAQSCRIWGTLKGSINMGQAVPKLLVLRNPQEENMFLVLGEVKLYMEVLSLNIQVLLDTRASTNFISYCYLLRQGIHAHDKGMLPLA
jgi:hypothetical protein